VGPTTSETVHATRGGVRSDKASQMGPSTRSHRLHFKKRPKPGGKTCRWSDTNDWSEGLPVSGGDNGKVLKKSAQRMAGYGHVTTS